MTNRLKHFRARAGMTQSQVAAAVGISQPSYQRWETGAASIPDDRLARLADTLKTDTASLLGRHAPIEVSLYDSTADDTLSYYGEVAIHFQGGGEPLLLSISEDAFDRLHRDLQGDAAFVIVQSLTNETVAIRPKAIADVYFSSEAYDDFGPEEDRYSRFTGKQLADPRDWQIIAALASDVIDLEEFAQEDVERVRGWVMITDEQFEALVADGSIKPDKLEVERAKMRAMTDRLFALATETVWQFSTGVQRREEIFEERALFNAFYPLVDFGDHHSEDEMLRIACEGRHRIIFINPRALDYVSIPTHSFEEGHSLVVADELDAMEAAEAERTSLPKPSTRKGRARR